jgi:hypothetical protein
LCTIQKRFHCGCTGFFVLIPFFKNGEIKFVVNEMIQGVLKGTGEDLLPEIDRYEFTLSV